MKITTERFSISTKGHTHMVDITNNLQKILTSSNLSEGQLTVFAPGATAGISTVEYEPGLKEDIPEMFERIAPSDKTYHHDMTWHDGNGHSHCRATLMGPSLTIPFENQNLILGTWQQVVYVDFDNKARQRQVVVQLMGVEG